MFSPLGIVERAGQIADSNNGKRRLKQEFGCVRSNVPEALERGAALFWPNVDPLEKLHCQQPHASSCLLLRVPWLRILQQACR